MNIIINIYNHNTTPRTENMFTSDFGVRRQGELISYDTCKSSDFGTRNSLIDYKCECSNCRDSDFGSRPWSNVF